MTDNADQLAYWNDVAGPKWVANQARLDQLMVPLTVALIEGAAAQPGESVLDVGCGCGDLALRLADAVGPAGRVVGVDVSEPMLAHARHRTEAARLTTVDWHAADAMTAAFEPVFDVIVSRFGVMFFDDRTRAFANLRRALKPGGRFALLAWRSRAEVEWMQSPLDWLAPILPMPASMDGQIGPFGLADGPGTCALLTSVGFHDVACRPIDHRLVMGVGIDEALALLRDTGPAAAAMREMEPDLRDRAVDLLREALASHVVDGRVELAGACWLYSGRA